MYSIKSNLILVLLVLLSVPAATQQLNQETVAYQKDPKRVCEFSLFIGRSYLGPVKDINASMRASGLNGIQGNQNVSEGYPSLHKNAPYFFEFTFNINQSSGISLSKGRNDVFSVRRDVNSATVRSKLKATSFGYVHSLGHNRHELTLGISFISLHMKSINGGDRVYGKNVTKKVGINFGYSYHIIETKGFFLAFNTQYTWAGTADIGPYSIDEQERYFGLLIFNIFSIPSRTTYFPSAKVHLDSINVGFSVGFRFGEKTANVLAHH